MKPIAYFMHGIWCVQAPDEFFADAMSKHWNGRRLGSDLGETLHDWWETYTGWELILRVRGVRPSETQVIRCESKP